MELYLKIYIEMTNVHSKMVDEYECIVCYSAEHISETIRCPQCKHHICCNCS